MKEILSRCNEIYFLTAKGAKYICKGRKGIYLSMLCDLSEKLCALYFLPPIPPEGGLKKTGFLNPPSGGMGGKQNREVDEFRRSEILVQYNFLSAIYSAI